MDIVQAQEAIFTAQAKVMEFQRTFMQVWMEPLAKQQMRLIWSQMPPEAKELLKQQDKASYEEVTDYLNGG